MALFINGIGSISPAPPLAELLPQATIARPGNRLRCLEPDYSAFLDPKLSRRMSRIVKMGLVASMQALRGAELTDVQGVIAGTGWGCLEDTISFLQKMVVNEEDMLSPSAFIHSTHNTIAGQVAYHLKCRGYNSTYVHRNISFESSLIDATLLLAEQAPGDTLLVGGIDELTDTSFHILSRLHTFKAPTTEQPAELYASGTPGTWAGEGATFFALSNQATASSQARLLDVKTVSFGTPAEAADAARRMLRAQGLTRVDLLLSGYNGDADNDAACALFEAALGHQPPVSKFKHWCGEYPTASAFAVALAASWLTRPPDGTGTTDAVKTILIYNRFQQAHQSLLLLSAC